MGDHVEGPVGAPVFAKHGGSGDPVPPRPLPHFLAEMYSLPHAGLGPQAPSNDMHPHDEGPASELDCLRQVLAAPLLIAAEARSRDVGIGADRILIQWGVIDETAYLQWLSRHTGIPLAERQEIARADIRLHEPHLPHAAEHGLLPLRSDDALLWGIAPRGFSARHICRLSVTYPDMAARLRLLSTPQFNELLIARAGGPLAHAAADGLGDRFATMTAAPARVTQPRWRAYAPTVAAVSALAIPAALWPRLTLGATGGLLAAWFLAFAALRIAGAMAPRPSAGNPRRMEDYELPLYTVIVALYREATSVAPLLRAIQALDYPPEKLQIILAVEPNDLETRAAIARLRLKSQVQVLVAPNVGPQTKPKALNWALPFAHGSLVAVYDAEDRPEPNQLRAAVAAFRHHGDDIACVQASLRIDNISDSWLSRMFATEYAGQFDVFLPGLATLRMPLPLGGSSNHFRTDILRHVGGWDAYNVTEDADLGLRLARFGYRTMTFASSTGEEAPIHFLTWMKQRSRWMKGWMQTWCVHMRSPRRLWREAGPRGFLSLNVLVGGNVLTALACPIFFIGLAAHLASIALGNAPTGFLAGPLAPLHAAAILSGYLSTVAIGLMGLARRRQLRSSWVLLMTPIYWMYLSIAAWRALIQLYTEPYRWEKTEHGLTRERQASAPPPMPSIIRAQRAPPRRLQR
ncbi:MAG TPA: glycosyltransferase [Xanthobacteraceae bacterium]